jgi:hypothetical protein
MMSGHGRYQGRGSYLRRRTSIPGRSGKTSHEKTKNSSVTNSSSAVEMKFVPQYSSKQQVVTYDMVKDHVINLVQKTYKYGVDIAQALCEDMELAVIGTGLLEREMVVVPERVLSRAEVSTLQLEQNGFNIDYKEALRTYKTRKC